MHPPGHHILIKGRSPTCNMCKTVCRHIKNNVMVHQNHARVLFVKMKGMTWIIVGGTVQSNHDTTKNNKM